ncbi:MAG TPA: ISKra4 family transposase, partial [Acetobacteraceae bacterium]
MRVSILLQVTGDDGAIGTAQEVAVFEKATGHPEDLGLSIAEGKAMLAAVQARTVLAQAATWSRQRQCCSACGKRRRSKGSYPLVFRSLYGDVELDSPRLHRCPCQAADGPATVSPLRDLIPSHVA